MRKLTAGLVGWSILLFQPAVHAGVLLEKTTAPGFVMPAYAISKRCTIHTDGRMAQTYQIGAASSKRGIVLTLGRGIADVVDVAAQGAIQESNIPVDLPTIGYYAYQNSGGHAKKIILLESNGGSGIRKENDAEAALQLRNFIDLNCGDAIGQN
ncbi:MAG: hypothetical protein EPN21_16930 [Methylococcaceae bacterium]|nr:MAG: hypothetical protein EPN21_16930 [Methylococcaceae bacterium]